MKFPLIICCLAVSLIACGRQVTVAERPAESQPEAFADLAPADSKSFSETERNAVKSAKAHLEAQRKKAIDARYKVKQISTGHEVFVMFVGGYDANRQPLYLPGGHCTVKLSEVFRVVHVYAGQ
jgi:hypothetical protein